MLHCISSFEGIYLLLKKYNVCMMNLYSQGTISICKFINKKFVYQRKIKNIQQNWKKRNQLASYQFL